MHTFMIMAIAVILICLLAAPVSAQVAPGMTVAPAPVYKAQDYSHLLGNLPGISDRTLKAHFSLYQGYVTNTNDKLSKLRELTAQGKEKSPEHQELIRRLGWEFNGMRLHEYYFGNLGKGHTLAPGSPLYRKIEEDFGSFDAWKKDFVGTGATRGIGWVALYQDPANKKLINMWIEEHNVNHFPDGRLILIMDVFEHAYYLDYETERAKYIDAFFNNVNWQAAEQRLMK